ncbi:hypothetical protein HPB52_021191 [Rhipicephalus sanguineus]|uniref:CCHC-type domain-containing protein n=1 Tax=Rhipicephalus sanguineus TaxID=34632 RepID=A0A9D4PPY3_RHISA|nr:hypothetical protein HPB52_021191 [Rhipicephalus sanguineus]
MMQYAVEGETITPEEFEAGEWAPVLKAQDRFKKSLYGDNAKNTPCETQAGSDGRKTHGAEQAKRGKAPVWKKRGPFLKMPATDFKVVYRPQNWDLSVVTARQLGCALRAAARLTSVTAAEEDLVRVNGTNNTLTVSTPCMNRSGAYATVKTLKLGDHDLPVSAYVAPLENSVRGVIYNAYDGCPVEEVRAGFLKKNEGMEILDARPLGKSKAIQITFGGKRVPRQVTYWNCLYAVIPYRNLVETCYNCRRVGHRADVCYRPKTNLCHRCGKDHPAPPEGEPLTCTPDCIVCHGAHHTGSRNCKFRLARKPPTGRQQSIERESQPGKDERHSRAKERSSSSGKRSTSKSRDRSSSFPPLPGGGGGEESGRVPSPDRNARDTTKKVSLSNAGSQNETARERELETLVQQQGDLIKKMEARIAEMERALKSGQRQGVQAPTIQGLQKATQAASARVQESAAMEVENRGPVKRPLPADEGVNAKRLAETSTVDMPQPVVKVTSLKADVTNLAEKVGKQGERQDRLEARVDKIEARLDKIEERLGTLASEFRASQTQVMGMFQQLHTLLEARLPPAVGQAPTLDNLLPHHGPSPTN